MNLCSSLATALASPGSEKMQSVPSRRCPRSWAAPARTQDGRSSFRKVKLKARSTPRLRGSTTKAMTIWARHGDTRFTGKCAGRRCACALGASLKRLPNCGVGNGIPRTTYPRRRPCRTLNWPEPAYSSGQPGKSCRLPTPALSPDAPKAVPWPWTIGLGTDSLTGCQSGDFRALRPRSNPTTHRPMLRWCACRPGRARNRGVADGARRVSLSGGFRSWCYTSCEIELIAV